MTERYDLTSPLEGLYDPAFDRDSCGFGLIAHRGAVNADGKTGDGCGLLIKFPETFLRAVGEEAGLHIAGRFAAGTVFLSQDDGEAELAREIIGQAIEANGLDSDSRVGWQGKPPHRNVTELTRTHIDENRLLGEHSREGARQ